MEKQLLLEGYNWKNYGDMDVEFQKKHQHTSLQNAKLMIERSHKTMISLINKFTNEALFEKGNLAWTGGSTLEQPCVSLTASHYVWVSKKITSHIKRLS